MTMSGYAGHGWRQLTFGCQTVHHLVGPSGERVTLPCVAMTSSARGLNHYHAHFHSDVAALQKLWFVDTLVS